MQRASQNITIAQSDRPFTIAFGSCYGLYEFKSSVFKTIADTSDLFVWLGDVAYLDTHTWYFKFSTTSEEYIRGRFQLTRQAEGYSDIKHVIGVWDDHDFGINDSGAELEDKKRNRELFLDFIDEPMDTDRRLQKDTPIY